MTALLIIIYQLASAHDGSLGVRDEAEEDSESEGGGSTSQLIDDFHSMTLNSFCEPAFQRRVRMEGRKGGAEILRCWRILSSLSLSLSHSQDTHISALPIEIMRYILRWVVSAQLDMRSLEQVSKVQYTYKYS